MYASSAFKSESHFNLGLHESKCRHKKRYCTDTGRERVEIVRIVFNRHPLGLEGISSDVVCHEHSFCANYDDRGRINMAPDDMDKLEEK